MTEAHCVSDFFVVFGIFVKTKWLTVLNCTELLESCTGLPVGARRPLHVRGRGAMACIDMNACVCSESSQSSTARISEKMAAEFTQEDGFSCEATPRSFQRTSGNMIVFMHLHVLREVAEARTVASSPPAFGEARFLVPDLIVAGGLERSGELGSASCMLLFDPCSALLAEYPPSLVASTSMRHDSDSAAFLCWSYGSALLDRRLNVATSVLQSVTYLCLAGMVEASAWQGFRWLRRGRSAAAALSQMPAPSPAGIWPLTGPKSWKVLRMCLRFFVIYFSSLASA